MNRNLRGTMKKTWRSLMACGLLTAAALAGCSKANNIDTGADVQMTGNQCSGAGDEGCGVGSVCVLGQCRHGCTNDAECPQGSICVGDRPPYGCTTEEESACASNDDCPNGLDCGLDGKCRHGCQTNEDCPRNEHRCIGLTCASESEADFDQWLCDREATFDDERWGRFLSYREGTTWSCNVERPGNDSVDTCNTQDVSGFAQTVSPTQIYDAYIFGAAGEALACPVASCPSGVHVCPAELTCDGDEMCEACSAGAYDEPFACRPSQNPMLEQCTCLDGDLMPDCGKSERGFDVDPLNLVMREVVDCQLVIPDAIRYNDTNGIVFPLAKDQALVVSDQGVLVPGADYELTDGVITFSQEACSRTQLTTYVCPGSCIEGIPGDPGTCEDIQDAPGFL